MTAIRIVCSFDAADLADTLMRLLAAEQHDVRLSRGRQSQAELPEARAARKWCCSFGPRRRLAPLHEGLGRCDRSGAAN